MSVSKFSQPDFTAQDAAAYKTSIDSSIAALAQYAIQFAPTEMATPAMGIQVDAGLMMDGTVLPAQNLTGIGAPSSDPRIDRVYLDINTQTLQRLVGTEAASPTPPPYPIGVFPICQIVFYVGQTSIVNADIIDERNMISIPVGEVKGAYTQIVDPDHLTRILIGRGGVDNRIIIKTHTSDALSKVVVQDSSGTPIFSIDGAGNVIAKGSITPNGTP